MFLPEKAVAAVAPCAPTASHMDVSEEAGDEGNLVICRRAQQGAAQLRRAPSLVQELMMVLRVFPTAARGTSFSNS